MLWIIFYNESSIYQNKILEVVFVNNCLKDIITNQEIDVFSK